MYKTRNRRYDRTPDGIRQVELYLLGLNFCILRFVLRDADFDVRCGGSGTGLGETL